MKEQRELWFWWDRRSKLCGVVLDARELVEADIETLIKSFKGQYQYTPLSTTPSWVLNLCKLE